MKFLVTVTETKTVTMTRELTRVISARNEDDAQEKADNLVEDLEQDDKKWSGWDGEFDEDDYESEFEVSSVDEEDE